MKSKKVVSFTIIPKADKKLKEVAKILGFSKSEIVEYLILSKLPNTTDKEELKEFAKEITEWIIEQRTTKQENKGKIILPNSNGINGNIE